MRFIKVLQSRKGKPIDLKALKALDSKITAVCKKFKLDLFYLFGSYGGGKADHLSDLDLAYFSRRNIETLKLLAVLQDLFEEEAIDLVNLKTAPSTLTHRVLQGKCLYAKDLRTKIDFEMHAESEYFDTAYMRKVYFTEMLRRLHHGTYGA